MFGIDDMVPVTLFNKGQASKIFDRVKAERQLLVLKNNAPSAVIVSPEEYNRLMEIEEDYHLLLQANERLEKNNAKNALNEIDALKQIGVTEEEIALAEDIEVI